MSVIYGRGAPGVPWTPPSDEGQGHSPETGKATSRKPADSAQNLQHSLRRRTATGEVHAESRTGTAQQPRPRTAALPVPRPAESTPSTRPDASRPKPPPLLGDYPQGAQQADGLQARDVSKAPQTFDEVVQKFIPLIHEVKNGTPVHQISQRPQMSSFGAIFDAQGNLKASSTSFRSKLDALRTKDRPLYEAFNEAISRPRITAPTTLEKLAREIELLIPLVLEVKKGISPYKVGKRAGLASFDHIFDAQGNLNENAHASAFQRKLESVRQTHPRLAQDFDEAVARPCAPRGPTPEELASEIKALIPLVLEVKKGVSLSEIRRRPGMASFGVIFDQQGKLRQNPYATAVRDKLEAIRETHGDLFKEFQAATEQPAAQRRSSAGAGTSRAAAEKPALSALSEIPWDRLPGSR